MKTALEAVLQAMVAGAWANESDGDVEAPTGYFARISNSEAELAEVEQAFSDVIEAYGMEDTRELVGHFLVVQNDQGFVYITSYENPIELTRDYQALQDAYAQWDEDA